MRKFADPWMRVPAPTWLRGAQQSVAATRVPADGNLETQLCLNPAAPPGFKAVSEEKIVLRLLATLGAAMALAGCAVAPGYPDYGYGYGYDYDYAYAYPYGYGYPYGYWYDTYPGYYPGPFFGGVGFVGGFGGFRHHGGHFHGGGHGGHGGHGMGGGPGGPGGGGPWTSGGGMHGGGGSHGR